MKKNVFSPIVVGCVGVFMKFNNESSIVSLRWVVQWWLKCFVYLKYVCPVRLNCCCVLLYVGSYCILFSEFIVPFLLNKNDNYSTYIYFPHIGCLSKSQLSTNASHEYVFNISPFINQLFKMFIFLQILK